MVDDEGNEFTRTERKPARSASSLTRASSFTTALTAGRRWLDDQPRTKSIDEAKNYINEVRAKGGVENNPEYAQLVAGIEGYFESRSRATHHSMRRLIVC